MAVAAEQAPSAGLGPAAGRIAPRGHLRVPPPARRTQSPRTHGAGAAHRSRRPPGGEQTKSSKIDPPGHTRSGEKYEAVAKSEQLRASLIGTTERRLPTPGSDDPKSPYLATAPGAEVSWAGPRPTTAPRLPAPPLGGPALDGLSPAPTGSRPRPSASRPR